MQKPKSHDIIWFICRVLLLGWGIWGLFHGYTTEFLQALFAIVFTHLWDMFQLWGGRSFIRKVSYRFQTQLNVFICIGCVVGTTLNNRSSIQFSDIILHFFAGYISACFMYEFARLLQGEKRETGPAMQSMFSIAGALALLIGWEFYEFSMDRIYGMALQCSVFYSEAGLTDTMWDLIIGAGGALCGMLLTAFRENGIIGKKRKKKVE